MTGDFDKNIVKLSFNSSFEKCVRLVSFGLAVAPINDPTGYSAKIAQQLAHNDLLILAISTRRLMDAGNLQSSSGRFEVTYQVPYHSTESGVEFIPARKRISIRTVFNKIIHASQLEIHTNEFRIGSQLGILGSDSYNLYRVALKAKNFKPVCEIWADNKKLYYVEIAELALRRIDFLHQTSEDLKDQIDLGQYTD